MADKMAPAAAVIYAPRARVRPDFASFFGIIVAVGAILGGLVIEGGKLNDILQLSAAFIVLGGTLGAVMVTTPLTQFRAAIRRLPDVFLNRAVPNSVYIDQMIALSSNARKSGLVSLEQDLFALPEPFLRKALALGVDGVAMQDIQKTMELEIQLGEQCREAEAKVYEAAGGYAPTIGIIGAVLGLIQVMKHIDNVDEVGKGIAVAFVATVYGVGSANLFFLPAANKLKAKAAAAVQAQEMILEGVCSIVSGMNPKLIRSKLEAYSRAGRMAVGTGGAGPSQTSTEAAA
jgi:chemotaxis protein MotA